MDWHDILDPADPELDRLAEIHHLHPLHVEDCRHRNQSAKVEENENYIFIVLKPVDLLPDGTIDPYDLDIFLGRDFLITVREGGEADVKRILEPLHAQTPLRASQLMYRILDGVVDSYLPKLEHYNEVIDHLEDQCLESPDPGSLSRIFETKRALIELRRVLGNMRDLAGHLQRIDSDLIPRDLAPFLRDVYDHLSRNLDMVEMERDLLNGALDIYLSAVANRTNQVMKVLTVLGTIALPALVISGFYGMNVRGLPWVDSPVVAAACMAVTTILLLVILRILRWF